MTLITATRDILQQGETLLLHLSDPQYAENRDPAFSSSIGAHYRHCLEHFTPLLSLGEDSLVDYDARKRDTGIETDRNQALACTRTFLQQTEHLSSTDLDRDLKVRCSVAADADSPEVRSSLGRELMYAIIHAVHHYAMIRMLCSRQQISLPETFGVAPSTTRHLQGLQNT